MVGKYDFARGQQFMDAIRSSGYKNAAMALGELVDNSIQAGASDVDILVTEHRVRPSQRLVTRIKEIGVLDNGKGMDPEVLRRALKLGDGTHFDESEGIGKFGVGLPQASVSQAKRVDVWTWQNGKDPHHTYIDLDDDEWVEEMVIPEPSQKEIPAPWRKMTSFDDESGTLVVWSTVDRCTWKKASTLHRHSQALIGRMYRNWLHPDTKYNNVDISLIVWNLEEDEVSSTREFEPNDPLYLLDNTSVALPEGVPDPPFEQFGDPREIEFEIEHRDGTITNETVTLTYSICKPETRRKVNGQPAGSAPHGKHAKENIGLSIVREGRELTLDKNWATKDPRNRWWGAQVEFGRQMDDIFGVTNNKQGADRLTEVANKEWEDFAEHGESTQETKERLKEEDFPTYVCLTIKHEVDNQVSDLLVPKVLEIGQYTETEPEDKDEREKRHEDSAERHGTEAAKSRQETGNTGQSDDEEDELTEDERKKEISERLREQGFSEDEIEEVTGEVVDLGLKFSFVDRPTGGSEIFTVEPTAGAILIGLNTDHVAYQELFSTLDLENEEELDPEEAAEKLEAANIALKLLLEAWARMEDEASDDENFIYKDLRNDWGRVARDFLRQKQIQSETS